MICPPSMLPTGTAAYSNKCIKQHLRVFFRHSFHSDGWMPNKSATMWWCWYGMSARVQTDSISICPTRDHHIEVLTLATKENNCSSTKFEWCVIIGALSCTPFSILLILLRTFHNNKNMGMTIYWTSRIDGQNQSNRLI